jgi:hypothetical protein
MIRPERSWKRVLVSLFSAGGLALTFGLQPAPGVADTLTNPKHFFWANGQPDPSGIVTSQTTDLLYHGGSAGSGAIGVETQPATYLIYWGPEWGTGFTTNDADGTPYSSKTLQKYTNSFFDNVGGSAWADVTTQYCKNVPVDTTNCAAVSGATYITSPSNQLKGVWVDTTPVPDDIITLGLAENLVDDPIATEAIRASAHFGYNPQATYIILVPPKPVATGQPVYCGYHTQTTSIDGYGNPYRIQYSFIPFLNTVWPVVGQRGCGMHNVNASSDAFGNGIFDGYSIVTGHEYAEAITDPDNFSSIQDGWNDYQTSENGDKCAWTNTHDITLAGHSFAVQPTWSNRAFDATGNGCPVSP